MTPEMISIFAVAAALGAPIQHGQRATGARMDRLEAAIGELRERMERLEGLFKGFAKAKEP